MSILNEEQQTRRAHTLAAAAVICSSNRGPRLRAILRAMGWTR